MKKLSILFCALLCTTFLSAQLNMTLRSEVTYDEDLSDIWGYEANGREYAIVCLRTGVNIVDVTDPDNPVDLGTARGASSTWRDVKTWAGFAYITNETSGGVMVIDLRGLPNAITEDDFYEWTPNLNGEGPLVSCHNIYVDEFGYGYITGCNLNNGGAIILDLFTTPGDPIHVGNGPAIYSHDIYTRENIMYASEIYNGYLALYDVTDKENPIFINSQPTPSDFTHNAWLSDDGNTVFTTDERANAPVAAYDISDPTDIKELDQYRPIPTLGDGVIPHNVHVWEDWLIISYYTDGCIIVDGSRPSNLIEVGNFDTFIPNSTGFSGVWGVYPFLPSRTIIAADIGNGLFVLTPDYKRACWLEGKVTDKDSGANLVGVDVSIDASQANLSETNFQGDYQTGLADAGSYDVTYSKFGYFPQTIKTDLDNGQLIIQNVQLEPIKTAAAGKITNEVTGAPIPFAKVQISSADGAINTEADADGSFTLEGFIPTDYNVIAGSWGFQTKSLDRMVEDGAVINIALQPGYYDDFSFDFGWQAAANATAGLWERGEPVGTFNNNTPSNPDNDLPNDFGDQCYVTGNGGGGAGNDDVDGGLVRLTSPAMDLSKVEDPILHFQYWFYNAGGSGGPNDLMSVSVSNGTETQIIEEYNANTGGWSSLISFDLKDFITLTDNVRIIFEAADNSPGHLVEAAVDGFLIEGALPTSVSALPSEAAWQMQALPSTFSSSTQIQYQLSENSNAAQLYVYNTLGQRVESLSLEGAQGTVLIGEKLQQGIYFVQIEDAQRQSETLRVVKAQ